MPYRRTQFITGDYYHIFNKTIDRKTPFLIKGLCSAFLHTAHFYRASDLKISYSNLKQRQHVKNLLTLPNLNDPFNYRVNIIAFCLMPNHFHFILQQNVHDGVQDFISNTTNSFTRVYNRLNNRKGPLFLSQFRAVPVINTEQLLTASRYIHLNPIASHVVNTLDDLRTYSWSSYKDYINSGINLPLITQKDQILYYFKRDPREYQQFVENDFDRLQTLSYIQDTLKY